MDFNNNPIIGFIQYILLFFRRVFAVLIYKIRKLLKRDYKMENITLRDGTVTHSKKLDRCVDFDKKSRNFPINKLVPPKPITTFWDCKKTLNQGSDGACVGFGISHELIAKPVVVKKINNRSARELYFEAQKTDQWEGGAYPGADPIYEGTSVLAGVKVAQKKGYFDDYGWAFGLDDLILGVGHSGPAVLGTNWYMGMVYPDRNGFISVTGEFVGGHCLLCRGVNVEQEYFVLKNSWGPGWGRSGDCCITFGDMDKLLEARGEAVFFIGRHKYVRSTMQRY